MIIKILRILNITITFANKKQVMHYLGFDKSEHFDRISLYHGDCMDLMKQTPDKYFDLAIVMSKYFCIFV